jgi:acetyltransferase-like isoleucine patch superfamily enzyme
VIRRILQRFRDRGIGYLLRVVLDTGHERVVTALSTAVFRLSCLWHGVRCGSSPEVYGRVLIRSPRGTITIGNRVQFISSVWRSSAAGVSHPVRLRTFAPSARIIFGDGSGMSGGSVTARSRTIRIGKNTLIGPDCLFVDSDFHVPWPPEARGNYSGTDYDGDITVGDNVWFGARCMVLKGVTIGDNAVIGAGGVVVHDIPANVLAAGNPARVIRHYGTVEEGPTR